MDNTKVRHKRILPLYSHGLYAVRRTARADSSYGDRLGSIPGTQRSSTVQDSNPTGFGFNFGEVGEALVIFFCKLEERK
jgi:hypothetical protein